MPGPGSSACPKPEKRSKTKRRKDRKEAAVAKAVREDVEDRDGYCRFNSSTLARIRSTAGVSAFAFFGPCDGPGEWAHLGEKRRSKTRGMDPEERHTVEESMKLCRGHHQGQNGYDRHGFEIEYLTERKANGPLRAIRRDGAIFDEVDLGDA